MDGMNMMGEGSADGAVIDDLQVRCACKPPDAMVLLLTANADWESSPSTMPSDSFLLIENLALTEGCLSCLP
jgi:hypothetical protein